ncbi:MAG: endonuclease Q family protein [Bacillota bacterium]
MRILDLHIHSRFARACSPKLDLAGIDSACRVKGVDVVVTGDFTHPVWYKELREELEQKRDTGLYIRKGSDGKTLFLIGTEVSLVYRDGGKARRIHLVVLAPNLEAAASLNNILGKRFNLRADGRPILGISAPEFISLCLDLNPAFLIYPAHIWTPWYSVLGSKSGFDSLEECFKEQTENIYAYETGLSSDPPLNWRVSALDGFCRLSNSDAHSPENIGREANVVNLQDLTYEGIYRTIRHNLISENGSDGFVETIEFFPEEGMYHWDGHRDCGFCSQPAESRRLGQICPRCGRPLVIGVASRVAVLADRPEGYRPENALPFRYLLGLDKVIAAALGVKGRSSSAVKRIYDKMIEGIGPELYILRQGDLTQVEAIHPATAVALSAFRAGKIELQPGFDGQYGKVKIIIPTDRK